MNSDPGLDVVGPSGSGRDLEDPPAVAHGAVAGDGALGVETEDVVDLVGPGERHEGAVVEFGRDCGTPPRNAKALTWPSRKASVVSRG